MFMFAKEMGVFRQTAVMGKFKKRHSMSRQAREPPSLRLDSS